MGLLTALSGHRARHIFLCEEMRHCFEAKYGSRSAAIISSNGRYIAVQQQRTKSQFYRGDRPLRMGLLSNLCPEKGLNDFLEILDRSRDDNLDIVGVLAGPPVSDADAARIEGAVASLDGRLRFLGPVYGEDKLAFFEAIDVLVFPTRYRCETYPLVIVEALASGVPVVAYGRGCIPSCLEAPSGFVIPPEKQFSMEAITIFQHWRNDIGAYQTASRAASRLSQRLKAQADDDFKTLIEALIGHAIERSALAQL